jgi:hypothetical protein
MGVAALCVLAGDGGPARAAGPLTFVRSISLLGSAHDVAIAHQYIFVATDTGMTILDASSDPASPVVRGSVAVGGTPTTRTQGIAVEWPRAYLASQRAGVSVVDISNPDAPRVVSTKILPQPAWDVAVKGNIVYAVTNGGQLYVLDGADNLRQLKVIGLLAWSSASQDPAWLKKLNAHLTTGSAKALSVSVVGNQLFTVDWGYGRLYYYTLDSNLDSLASPASPRFRGTHYAPFILAAVADPAKDVVYMLGAYARFSGIYTVPISLLGPNHSTRYNTCPACRFLKSTGTIDQGGLGLSPGGDHLFYGGGREFEFHVVDVSDPATLHDVASANTGNHALPMPETMGFASSGDLIYVGAGIQGLQIYQFGGALD